MGRSPLDEYIVRSKRESYAKRLAHDKDSQPLSYYEEDIGHTLVISGKRYGILKSHVEKYPLLIKGDIHGAAGHTVVHFLHTGTWETINSPLDLYVDLNEREFQRSVYVYQASRSCHIPDLALLAIKRIGEHSKDLPMLEVVRWTAEIFPKLPKNEVWFQAFVGSMLRRSAEIRSWKSSFNDLSKMLARNQSFHKAISEHVFDHLHATTECLELTGGERGRELAKVLRSHTEKWSIASKKRLASASDATEMYIGTRGTTKLEESLDRVLPNVALYDQKETPAQAKRRKMM